MNYAGWMETVGEEKDIDTEVLIEGEWKSGTNNMDVEVEWEE